jgi:two-component system, NtrC family, sensor kinase
VDNLELYKILNEQFYGILQNLSDAVISIDTRNNNVLHANPSAEKLFGHSILEFKADPDLFMDTVHPEDKAIVKQAMKEILENKECSKEYRIVRPDGSISSVMARSRIANDELGKIIRMDCVITDITGYKAAEKKIEEEKARFKNYFEMANVIFIVLNPTGRVIDINRRGCEILGYEKDKILKMDWFKCFLPEKEREEIKRVFDKLTVLKKAENSNFIKIRHENAVLNNLREQKQISWNNTVMFDAKGDVQIVIAIGEDVTELRKVEAEKLLLQKQLFQSAKLASLGTLGAGIAHELNNPLAIITGFAQQLLEMSKEDKMEKIFIESSLNKIINQVDKMAFIINHVKEFSRSTDPKSRRQIDITRLIDDSLLLFRKQLSIRGISMEIYVEKETPFIWGNAVALESVLHNLIGNSRDALENFEPKGTSEKKISVNVRYVNESDEITIEVTDNGKGISRDDQARLFDPFFTTKDIGKGTGLGLSLCHGIIEDHGGTIDFSSKEGIGTTFKITLPVDVRGRTGKE